MPIEPALFEQHQIRRVYDEATETWWFSVVDILQVLIQQPDYQTARKYWNKLKTRLNAEGSQSVTNCHRLKLTAADGKQYLTDVATAETLLRLVQSVPSPKAEPIKLWLAKVGHERMQEMADPALALNRARELWQKHGRSEKWIQQRMSGQETRNKLTDYWADHDIKEGQECGGCLQSMISSKTVCHLFKCFDQHVLKQDGMASQKSIAHLHGQKVHHLEPSLSCLGLC